MKTLKTRIILLIAALSALGLVGCVKDNSMEQAKILVNLSRTCDGEVVTTMRTGQGGYIEIVCKGIFNNMSTAD